MLFEDIKFSTEEKMNLSKIIYHYGEDAQRVKAIEELEVEDE